LPEPAVDIELPIITKEKQNHCALCAREKGFLQAPKPRLHYNASFAPIPRLIPPFTINILALMKLKTVGIKNIRFPVKIREKGGTLQETVASITLQVSIPRQYRETCISTFIAVLNKYRDEMSVSIFPELLAEVRDSLQAEAAHVEMTFPYFIEKRAPVTLTPSLMEYTCRFTGDIGGGEGFTLSVWVPSTTLCPCSKEISDYGAHNQRAEININVRFNGFIWVEDLIVMVEAGASCEVFALLKRPDEKYVTERAYDNPMFVEDVVRRVAESARTHPYIEWFSVGVESFESIHKHSAYAYVDSDDLCGNG
jgi:GTP cyclohydrolase IB